MGGFHKPVWEGNEEKSKTLNLYRLGHRIRADLLSLNRPGEGVKYPDFRDSF